VASFFVKIARIRDDILNIDKIFLDKEIVITALLGLPPTWGAFVAGLKIGRKLPLLKNYGDLQPRIIKDLTSFHS